MASEPENTTELADARKVTVAELRGLADVVTGLQERLALVEAHLQQDNVAYGGTPLTKDDDDYIEAEVTTSP